MKILIADKLSKVGLDWLAEQKDVEIDNKPGLKPDELARAEALALKKFATPAWTGVVP